MTAGRGVHRYDFDGRYAYISPTAEGYVGNIAMILDLNRPREPDGSRRAGGFPASWQAGGEHYPWGDGSRRAAIIRCAWATGSTSATGITACSSSTSPT